MTNPTGGKIRKDLSGDGRYGSSRGWRKHLGADYAGRVSQPVVAIIGGVVTRAIRVYADTPNYTGIEITNKHMQVKMLYLDFSPGLIGQIVEEGQVVGTLQDVTKHYKHPQKGDQPHIHAEVVSVDPEYLIFNGELLNGTP